MYIFISHSSKDATVATELCNIIEANGSQCFLAPRNIRSGFEYAAEIINGIDNSDAILLLLSENANSSPHILREIERAVSKSIPIIVYKLEDVVLSKSLEYFLMTHQWLNAEYGTHKQLLKCIEDMENNTSTAISTGTVVVNNTKHKSRLPLFIAFASTASIAIIILLVLFITISGDDSDKDNSATTTNIAENSSEVTTENLEDSTNNTNIKLGDTVVFGTYNDADIYWKVIKISDDGKEAVLIARDVLTFKAYDSANSGYYGQRDGISYSARDESVQADMQLQADIWGNSSWKNSDIRAWLNSENEVVKYEGSGPIAFALTDQHNSYNIEAGFLYNFTVEELAAIKETTLNTKGNGLLDGQTITTTDRVFLLSMDELVWLDNAGVSRLAVPTAEAIEKNTCPDYRNYCLEYYKTDASIYWLRDTVEGSAYKGYMVGPGADSYVPDNIFSAIVSCDGYGIRPAITVDLTSDCIKISK